MSGDDLRHAAQFGHVDIVKNTLKEKGNPCSTDSLGLSPLHYATWNGHTECVKYLLANPNGVTNTGVKCSVLDLVSVKQYTALHLVAYDCPPWSAKQICHLLLLFGADRTLRCVDGQTPHEIAALAKNEPVLEAFREFEEYLEAFPQPVVPPIVFLVEKDPDLAQIEEDADFEFGKPGSPSARNKRDKDKKVHPPGTGKLQKEVDSVVAKYRFMHSAVRTVDVAKIQETAKKRYHKHAFSVPQQLVDENATWNLPDNMQIYEHNINSLAVEGFVRMEGTRSYKLLDYIEGQATINMQRRDRLVKAAAAAKVDMPGGVEELEENKDARVVLEFNRRPEDDPERLALIAPKNKFALDQSLTPQEVLRETLQDRLVPALPHSQFQDRLPWDDDMLIQADREYLRSTVIKDLQKQQQLMVSPKLAPLKVSEASGGGGGVAGTGAAAARKL